MSEIIFDEVKHEYTRNRLPYISVTQLMEKYGLRADYDGIPKDILDKAAMRGRTIHKNLENYIGGDDSEIANGGEVTLFHTYVQQQGLDRALIQSEKIYYDDNFYVAGTVDLVYSQEGELVIADFKTTSIIHVDAVAWQLSIYNYLVCKADPIMYYFNKLKAFHFAKGRLVIKDIRVIEFEQVEALLQAHLNNAPSFTYVRSQLLVQPADEQLLVAILNEEQLLDTQYEQLKQRKDVLIAKVKKEFERQSEYSYKSKDISITYVSDITKESLDSKKIKAYFKANNIDITPYVIQSKVSSSIRVKLLDSSTPTVDDTEEDIL